MSVEQAYNYRRIDDTFSTAGILNEEQVAALPGAGFDTVINLLPDDSKYALPGERALVVAAGLGYHHVPVDFSAPSERDYAQFCALMEQERGNKLMIHCAANYRVSAFFAMYAYQQLGWSAERARALIEGVWQPRDHAPWADFIATVIPA